MTAISLTVTVRGSFLASCPCLFSIIAIPPVYSPLSVSLPGLSARQHTLLRSPKRRSSLTYYYYYLHLIVPRNMQPISLTSFFPASIIPDHNPSKRPLLPSRTTSFSKRHASVDSPREVPLPSPSCSSPSAHAYAYAPDFPFPPTTAPARKSSLSAPAPGTPSPTIQPQNERDPSLRYESAFRGPASESGDDAMDTPAPPEGRIAGARSSPHAAHADLQPVEPQAQQNNKRPRDQSELPHDPARARPHPMYAHMQATAQPSGTSQASSVPSSVSSSASGSSSAATSASEHSANAQTHDHNYTTSTAPTPTTQDIEMEPPLPRRHGLSTTAFSDPPPAPSVRPLSASTSAPSLAIPDMFTIPPLPRAQRHRLDPDAHHAHPHAASSRHAHPFSPSSSSAGLGASSYAFGPYSAPGAGSGSRSLASSARAWSEEGEWADGAGEWEGGGRPHPPVVLRAAPARGPAGAFLCATSFRGRRRRDSRSGREGGRREGSRGGEGSEAEEEEEDARGVEVETRRGEYALVVNLPGFRRDAM